MPAPSRRVACTTCDAPAGAPCVVWRMDHSRGRLYVDRRRAKPHSERVAAARAAGHQLPPGRPR